MIAISILNAVARRQTSIPSFAALLNERSEELGALNSRKRRVADRCNQCTSSMHPLT